MGQLIPDPPIEYGTDCPLCTPSLWPVGETPLHVYAFFDGMISCGKCSHSAPNGSIFTLPQVSGYPCLWYHSGDEWTIQFEPDLISPANSRVLLLCSHGYSFFSGVGSQCPQEHTQYSNSQTACILNYGGAQGYCNIFWNQLISELIEGFGLEAGSSLFYEMYRYGSTSDVHKFCDILQRTNLRIKI